MKISKLFHWLYAFLMIAPLIGLLFNFVRFSLSGSLEITSFTDVISLCTFPNYSSNTIYQTIYNVYRYLVSDLMGFNLSYGATGREVGFLIVNSLTYWTITSIVYLIFDVIMYVPLLVHRWIDKAVID